MYLNYKNIFACYACIGSSQKVKSSCCSIIRVSFEKKIHEIYQDAIYFKINDLVNGKDSWSDQSENSIWFVNDGGTNFDGKWVIGKTVNLGENLANITILSTTPPNRKFEKIYTTNDFPCPYDEELIGNNNEIYCA